MGQAKQRGSFEERKNKALLKAEYKQYTKHRRHHEIPPSKKKTASLLILMAMALYL